MNNYCGFCKHYIGGGDWNLCCDLEHEGYPFGFLCYADTDACERFDIDYKASQVFQAGFRLKSAHEVYVVTVVECIDGAECDPVNFIFDNEVSANECFRFFSDRKYIKLFMEKENVYGRFMATEEAHAAET